MTPVRLRHTFPHEPRETPRITGNAPTASIRAGTPAAGRPVKPGRPGGPDSPRRRSGFTLIEIMVVLSILGLLLTVVSHQQGRVLERSKDAALMKEVQAVRTAIYQYALDNQGTLPPDLASLKKYLGREVDSWHGGRGSGKYAYETASGQVHLYDRQGQNPETAPDSAGRPYGDY